jgi:hypothetical protein
MSGKGGRESICEYPLQNGFPERALTPDCLASLCDPSPTIRPTCECYSERMSPSHLHCCALHQLITVPTRMNLTVTKTRLKGAQTGHSLLKKKADALNKVRFSPALQ